MNDGDLQAQFAKLEERTEHIIKKIDEHKNTTNKIFDKLDRLPCDTHKERIKNNTKNVGRLYVFFVTVIVGGIILGIWIKAVLAK